MAQTNADTYGFSLDVAQAGQKADLTYDQVESFAAEGAVPMGFGLIFGTDPAKQVAVPADDAGTFAGISVFTHAQEQGFDQSVALGNQSSTGAEYRDGDAVSVLRRGRVYVEVTADDVVANEPAFIDVTSAGEEGKFTNVDTGNVATGGIFRTAGDTGDLVIVELNLP